MPPPPPPLTITIITISMGVGTIVGLGVSLRDVQTFEASPLRKSSHDARSGGSAGIWGSKITASQRDNFLQPARYITNTSHPPGRPTSKKQNGWEEETHGTAPGLQLSSPITPSRHDGSRVPTQQPPGHRTLEASARPSARSSIRPPSIGGSTNGHQPSSAGASSSTHHSSHVGGLRSPPPADKGIPIPVSRPSLQGSRSGPAVFNTRAQQRRGPPLTPQVGPSSSRRPRKAPASPSESTGSSTYPPTPPPETRYQAETALGQLGDMQRTYLEGMVSMTPTGIAREKEKNKDRVVERERGREENHRQKPGGKETRRGV
ncbi:hypothetical protein B2J93_145 [Marssonina coronariae]|uniref:Uncharacterized protein n=1 Tax=Diplocarpon coronariae TaxID=2795749 RepID=A0A218Z413_9HELO|nr:hypothetical protein B2J93_145 [Marssonina coronariae]